MQDLTITIDDNDALMRTLIREQQKQIDEILNRMNVIHQIITTLTKDVRDSISRDENTSYKSNYGLSYILPAHKELS